jgi:NitT/TauT family transport system permease protein
MVVNRTRGPVRVSYHCDRQRRSQRAADLRPRRPDDGSKRLHTWVHVILPASLPFVVSGMKQGWAFAWRSLMAAEIYVTILTGFGLGHLLHYGRELNAMDQVIGVMFVIVVIGLLADKILFSPWERFLHRPWATGRA